MKSFDNFISESSGSAEEEAKYSYLMIANEQIEELAGVLLSQSKKFDKRLLNRLQSMVEMAYGESHPLTKKMTDGLSKAIELEESLKELKKTSKATAKQMLKQRSAINK